MSLSKYQLQALVEPLEMNSDIVFANTSRGFHNADLDIVSTYLNEVSAEIMSGEPTGWDLAEAWDGINHDDEPNPRKVLTPDVKKARLKKAKAAKKARRKNR